MIIEDKKIGVRFGVKGDEDFKKWCEEKKRMIRTDAIEDAIKVVRLIGVDECSYNEIMTELEQLKEKNNE